MANKGQASGGGGCAAFIGILLAIALLLWAIKIALIVLGVVLVVGAGIGAILMPILLWHGVTRRPAAQESVEEFDDTLGLLSAESARRLSSAITAWDDLQRNRGVGTQLEKAYYAESVDDSTRELFDEISFYVEYGEELLDSSTTPADRSGRIDHLQEQDETTLQLESLRRRVR